MPTLEWIGKNKVVNHHQEVPFRVLERQYSFGEQGQHTENNDSENMIIHGDNLEALKALLPQYEGKVKCIYIDPPYNTGNEGWCYNDNVSDPHIQKWLGEVVGKEGEDLTRHDKWLCMMYPRLMLLQKLLTDDGVVFISIAGSHKSLLELGNNFIGGHTAGKQLFQYGFCFSLFGFFCGLFFGSNLFCFCFRKFLCCNLQSRFFTFQLFLQCANVVRQCGNLGFNLFLGCGLFSNNSRIVNICFLGTHCILASFWSSHNSPSI